MKRPLFAILDESGFQNNPDPGTGNDFAYAGLVVDADDVAALAVASGQIAEITRSKDFKYRHVQKSTAARAVFINAMNELSGNSGAIAMYAGGGSLHHERIRTQSAFASVGGEGNAFADEAGQLLRNKDDLHMKIFLGYFVPCFSSYSGRTQRPIQVHLDQRSDLHAIVAHCDEQHRLRLERPHFQDLPSELTFDQTSGKDFKAIGMLAGVLAGDIVQFFRNHGASIWSRLKEGGHGDQFDLQAATAHDINANYELTKVAEVQGLLGDRAFREGSRETCMLQGYYRHFVQGLISFASPNGIMGHIRIAGGRKWFLQQIPD